MINLTIMSTCTSTNDIALKEARDGVEEGTSYLSYIQTNGRGRNSKKWNSLKGNLFLSTILRPQKNKIHWPQISLIVGYSLIQTLISFGVCRSMIELKWPNDVLVCNKKISGVLLESADNFVVIGIGLNVSKKPENEKKWETTRLYDYIQQKMSLEKISYEILNQLFLNYNFWNISNFVCFSKLINKFLKYKGEVISIYFNSNKNSLKGTFLGLSENGSLKLLSGTDVFEYASIDNYYVLSESRK